MKLRAPLAAALIALAMSSTAVFAETKIKIAHGNPSFGLLQMFVAEAGGFMKAEGLEAEYIKVGAGAKTIAAIVSESADVAVTSASMSLYSQAEGVDVVTFGQLISGYHTPVVYSKAWMEKNNLTPESSFADRLAALKGARIATTGPGGGDQIIRFYAKKAGIDADRDMQILHFGTDLATYLVGVDADRIDGFAVGAPNSLIIKREKGGDLALNPPKGEAEELVGFAYVSALATRKWVDANPETEQALARAFQKALDAIQNPNQDNSLRDLIHKTYFDNVDSEIFAEAWEEAKLTSATTFTVQPEAMQKVANFVMMFDDVKLTSELVAKSYVEVKP